MTAQLAASSQAGLLDFRVRSDRNPIRLAFSGSPWQSAGYLVSYLVVSGVTFGVAVSAATTASVLLVTVLAIPLLLAAASLVHWCASVERGLLGQLFIEPVPCTSAPPSEGGLWARAKAAWTDRGTWRELAYLIGLWAPLHVLDTVVLSVWLTLLAGITLPIWYWAPRGTDTLGYVAGARVHGVAIGYFPNGATGHGAVGLYVDTLPKALLAAAIFAILFLTFNYVLVATARMHGRVARALLRPPADPLEDVKRVLAQPGPLGSLAKTGG
jgi:hypothetical protein